MILYHYTNKYHLASIRSTGILYPSESNVSWTKGHGGPDVVWLTTCDEPSLNHGLHGSVFDKTEVRISVELPAGWAKRWKKWAPVQGMSESDMDILAETGGGWQAADTWFVCTKPIPHKYWVEVAVAEGNA
jgi:hypothetical protein